METKLNLSEIAKRYSNENEAWKFIESIRWANGIVCPHCGSDKKAYFLKPQNGTRVLKNGNPTYRRLWKCAACRQPFSVMVGTIMEDSKIPASKWVIAFHALCAGKNGVSSRELGRLLGITTKSAWHLTQRIRETFARPLQNLKMSGKVEVDETYYGAKASNMHKAKRERIIKGRGTVGKLPIVSIVERGGEVRSQVMPNVNSETIRQPIRENVDTQATLETDASPVYNEVGKEFANHETVDHSAGEYARGGAKGAHINTVEGFFGHLKQSIKGTYRHISPKHTHRYLAEFDYRFGTRHIDDGARTMCAIEQSKGKRLMYKDLIAK